MHWEKLKNKRTRIQIRKARSRGCCGNLQQAPSLALRLSGVGAATCQAQLPLPPRLPPPAQCRSHGRRRGARAQTGPSAPPGGPSRPGLPLPAVERLFLSQSDTSTQRPPECTEPPSPTTQDPEPTKSSSLTHQLPGLTQHPCVWRCPQASATGLEINMQARDGGGRAPHTAG